MVDGEIRLKNTIYDLRKDIDEYRKYLIEDEDTIQKLKVMIEELKEENKKLLGAKGGYTKEINKLKKQVEGLDFKLKESMTGKYVLKKIPSGRKPKSQTMKIKDCSRISNISRKVFGDKQMKKTIKIIDLFKKIANSEETPYKIIYNNVEYTYEYDVQDYWKEEHNYLFEKLFCENGTKIALEIEVEILDEEEFEDIKELDNNFTLECISDKLPNSEWEKSVISKKINQLIKNQKKIIERLNDVKDKR